MLSLWTISPFATWPPLPIYHDSNRTEKESNRIESIRIEQNGKAIYLSIVFSAHLVVVVSFSLLTKITNELRELIQCHVFQYRLIIIHQNHQPPIYSTSFPSIYPPQRESDIIEASADNEINNNNISLMFADINTTDTNSIVIFETGDNLEII